MKVGFIGLGIMGKPMAGHLIAGGHELHLMSRSGVPQELLDQGGIAHRTPRSVAEAAEVVITMLPDTPDVERVLFGEEGVAEDDLVALDPMSRSGKLSFLLRGDTHTSCDSA